MWLGVDGVDGFSSRSLRVRTVTGYTGTLSELSGRDGAEIVHCLLSGCNFVSRSCGPAIPAGRFVKTRGRLPPAGGRAGIRAVGTRPTSVAGSGVPSLCRLVAGRCAGGRARVLLVVLCCGSGGKAVPVRHSSVVSTCERRDVCARKEGGGLSGGVSGLVRRSCVSTVAGAGFVVADTKVRRVRLVTAKGSRTGLEGPHGAGHGSPGGSGWFLGVGSLCLQGIFYGGEYYDDFYLITL